MKSKRLLVLVLVLVGACTTRGTGSGPEQVADQTRTRPSAVATQPTGAAPMPKHLRVDLKKRRLILAAEVVASQYPLEFLICRKGTKEYESVLATRAKPSDIHAALLMLGLTPGKPARWSGNDESARFLPPQGPQLRIALRWKDKQGARRQVDAGEWLLGAGRNNKPAPRTWIFIGSDVLPDGRYWADLPGEGGVVSVANLGSSVIDVPFESTQAIELREFVPNTKAIPPNGTAVEVVITPTEDAARSEHARALLDIDRFGRLRIDGRKIDLGKLSEWAGDYIGRHAKGQVIVRTAGRALVWDVQRARYELVLGGVSEITEQRLDPESAILPRTAEQARRSIQWWVRELVDPQELLDPVETAETVLKQISEQARELEAIRLMWAEYQVHLRQALKEYKASTQPAGAGAEQREHD